MTMKMKVEAGEVCDLCHHKQPTLYCSSDSAFLCYDCDFQVHNANFLVARHIRVSVSKSYDSDRVSCHDVDGDDDVLSSSSSSSSSCSSSVCNSSTNKTNYSKKISDWKTRDVLGSWCSRLGVSNSSSSSSSSTNSNNNVIEVARHAFQVWWVTRSGWPYRAGLAASLWLGLLRSTEKNKRIKMRNLLKRLEEISGVPAKSIVELAATLKMIKHPRQQQQQEESWAEC